MDIEPINLELNLIDGEKPSIVFLKLLEKYTDISGSDLGVLLKLKFDKLDSVVWNMVVGWKSSRGKNPEFHDKKFDLNLYFEFIKSGYQTPYTVEELEADWDNYVKNA